MCSLVSALAAREESVIHVFFHAYLLLVTSADNLFKQLQARHNFLARMCVYEVSYEPNSLRLFFKRTFSVLNHLPAFGGYFYSSECFCRNALMCSLF